MPGRHARLDRRLVGVDDRVGQPADAADQRHAAIAQAVKLGQPARLEARRHQHHVGAALDQMAQLLVIAGDEPDLARDAASPRRAKPFSSSASPEPSTTSCPPCATSSSTHADQHVDALLPGQPADDRRTADPVVPSSPNRSASARLVGARARCVLAAVSAAASAGSVAGFQASVSMPLRMPCSIVGAALQQPFEPHAVGGGADFVRIGRADRGERSRRIAARP